MNIARLRNTKAFTLIELIVVIVIMGILVAIGAFAYNAIVNSTHAKGAQLAGVQIAKTVQGQSAADQSTYGTVLAAYGAGAMDATDIADITSTITVATDGLTKLAVSKDGYCVAFTVNSTDVGTAITVPAKAVKGAAVTAAGATQGTCV